MYSQFSIDCKIAAGYVRSRLHKIDVYRSDAMK
jgi:hypothetical protein